jgi:CheY-like chemotaxis protein
MHAQALAPSAATRQDSLTLRHADGSRPRVLYAEDSTASRIVTTAMLKRMGLEVDAVEDGELALRQAEKSRYDVILLDIEMPVMDGVAAARGIRALGTHEGTPILALSAFLADSTEHCHWRDAFDHALPKPANGNELHRAIEGILSAKRQRATALDIATTIVNPTAPGAIALGLRSALPPGSWVKFRAMASNESVHYANAAALSFEFGDGETLRRCLVALRGLALNFEATDLAALAHRIEQQQPAADDIRHLVMLAKAWSDACH